MNKILASTLLGGLMFPVVGIAETKVFGQLNASYGFVNDNAIKTDELKASGSRMGVKGFTPLNNDLEATYIIEAGVELRDGDVLNETRQAWVGLRGGFGEVRAGRQYGATRVSSTLVDLFTDQFGDYNAVLESEFTHNESVAYINKYGPVGFAVEITTDDDLSPTTRRLTGTDFVINYSAQGLYGAVAMLNAQDNFKTARLTGAYTFPAGHRLGATFEKTDLEGGGGHDALLVSAGYQAGDSFFKVQYGTNKDDAGGKTETLAAIGIDYSLGKQTFLTFEHSINKNREHQSGDEFKATAFGLSHRF